MDALAVESVPVAAVPAPLPELAAPAPWSWPARAGQWFVVIYFGLAYFPFPVTQIPWAGERLNGVYEDGWTRLLQWFAAHVLHLAQPLSTDFAGSGDRTIDWLRSGAHLCLALVGSAAAMVFFRRFRWHAALGRAFRVWLRYVLAFSIWGYGVSKIFVQQFAPPDVMRLVEPYGDSSPMGLLWTFMGASAPYTIFSGVLEAAGSVLLLFRRTATLGAMLLAAVLANVFTLNLCYDVPVKRASFEWLCVALFLAAPGLRDLFRLALLRQPVSPGPLRPHFRLGWQRWGGLAAKLLIIASITVPSVRRVLAERAERVPKEHAAAPFGNWQVDAFQREGADVPPLVTDASRWRWAFTVADKFLRVTAMDGTLQWYQLENDGAGRALVLTKRKTGEHWRLAYVATDEDHLRLTGDLEGKPVSIGLSRIDRSKFPLVSRGFHWVSEYPFNH